MARSVAKEVHIIGNIAVFSATAEGSNGKIP